MTLRPSSLVACAFGLSLGMLAQGCSSPAATSSPSDAGTKAKAPDAGDAGTEEEDAGEVPIPVDYVDATTPDLQILPLKAYSGVDGTHKFQIPVSVIGGGADLTLTASDPASVTISPTKLLTASGDDGKWFLVVAKTAGVVMLTAASNGKSITSRLTIKTYDAADYTAGEARYMNGAGSEPACISCHAAGTGIDHSPATMGSASDGDVLRVVVSGLKVAGNPITSVMHKWTLTDAEKLGIVPYLRALAPQGFEGAK